MYNFKKHNLEPIFVFATVLLVVAAVSCRGETPPLATTPVLSPSLTRTTPTLQPTPSPTKTIATPSPQVPCLSGDSIKEQAQEALADWLSIPSEEIEVTKVEEVEWPDTSRGCPEPGMVYAQVIVPGWRVVMRAGGKIYEYHCGEGHGVLCDEDDAPLLRGQEQDTGSYFPPPISTREIVQPPLP